jgi:hypothetical protein
MEEVRNAHNTLVGKLERERRLGKPRSRWKNYIGMYIREIG